MSLLIKNNFGNITHIEGCDVVINNGEVEPTRQIKTAQKAEQNSEPSEIKDDMECRRGPKTTKLFMNDEIAKQETERLISFLHEHKLGKSQLDAAQDNSANQVLVCFFRVWKENNLLAKRAGATALARFISSIDGLYITVTEIAYSNALGRMISADDKFPNWNGTIRAYFQMN